MAATPSNLSRYGGEFLPPRPRRDGSLVSLLHISSCIIVNLCILFALKQLSSNIHNKPTIALNLSDVLIKLPSIMHAFLVLSDPLSFYLDSSFPGVIVKLKVVRDEKVEESPLSDLQILCTR